MIAALLAAFTREILSVTRTEEFFALPSAQRQKKVQQALGVRYPQAMCSYLSNCSEQEYVEDIRSLLPLLVSIKGVPKRHVVEGSSIAPIVQKTNAKDGLSEEFWSDLRSLLTGIEAAGEGEARDNRFIRAYAQTLSEEVADALDQVSIDDQVFGSQTHGLLTSFVETGREIDLGYEIQTFLREQMGVASPVIQSPQPLTSQEKQQIRSVLREQYQGSFVVFEVEASLGGGLRLFYQGTLFDESWMTQMSRVFAGSVAR